MGVKHTTMNYYLAHLIETESFEYNYNRTNEEEPEYISTGSSMVYDSHKLKVIESQTIIEIGEERLESYYDITNGFESHWLEKYIIIQELKDINFWRM